MAAPAAVRVNDNFSSSQTSIALWAANNESAAGLQVVDSVFSQVFSWYDIIDNILLETLSHVLIRDIIRVLYTDDNSVNADWHNLAFFGFMLDCDLSLAVRSQPS